MSKLSMSVCFLVSFVYLGFYASQQSCQKSVFKRLCRNGKAWSQSNQVTIIFYSATQGTDTVKDLRIYWVEKERKAVDSAE